MAFGQNKCLLTVSRCLPCLKSLIPDSRLSIHSSPPHCAMTPAILYTSSSSSSSSEIRSGKIFVFLVVKGYCIFIFHNWTQALVLETTGLHTDEQAKNWTTSCKWTVNLTCGWVQWLYELLCGISQQTSHSIDDSHWLTLGEKKKSTGSMT